MKRTIRLTESDIRRMVAESVRESLDTMGAEQYSDELNEGLLGMAAGAILDHVLIQKVVDMLANLLRLNRNGVLYRVLSSKLFAMALGNEIQNSIKLKRQQRRQGGQQGSSEMAALMGAKQGDEGSLKQLLGIGGGMAAGALAAKAFSQNGGMFGNMMGGMLGGNNRGNNMGQRQPAMQMANSGRALPMGNMNNMGNMDNMQYTPYEEVN